MDIWVIGSGDFKSGRVPDRFRELLPEIEVSSFSAQRRERTTGTRPDSDSTGPITPIPITVLAKTACVCEKMASKKRAPMRLITCEHRRVSAC